MEPYNTKYHTIITESNKRWKQNATTLRKSSSKNSIEMIPENTETLNARKEISIVELDSNKLPSAASNP